MKALIAALAVASLLSLAAFAGVASAVSFNVSYSDPASDVVKLWTANDTPVRTATGNLTLSPFPDSVNLLRIDSANASANVTLTLVVKGSIASLDNTSYAVRLFTRADNASHFTVTYVNGTTTLTSNATGFTPVDITGNSTITSTGPNPTVQNTLRINVEKSLLGTITSWNIDATATQRGTTYTYRDYGWELPGNPGSTPPAMPSANPWTSVLWIVAAVLIAVALVVVVLLTRRQKRERPKAP